MYNKIEFRANSLHLPRFRGQTYNRYSQRFIKISTIISIFFYFQVSTMNNFDKNIILDNYQAKRCKELVLENTIKLPEIHDNLLCDIKRALFIVIGSYIIISIYCMLNC